jgi:aromatic-L-amino-acid/L-tryptophan decarboxylase
MPAATRPFRQQPSILAEVLESKKPSDAARGIFRPLFPQQPPAEGCFQGLTRCNQPGRLPLAKLRPDLEVRAGVRTLGVFSRAMDHATFRRLGHALVDWVADYRQGIEQLPVRSAVTPGEIRARFPKQPPRGGQGLENLISLLNQDVLPGITHWNHPSFFAYFPSNTSWASILADLVASGLGAQGMNWETSPAATEVEEVVVDWLRQMVGLPEAFEGVIHDTASTATLCALICARERTNDFAQRGAGFQDGAAPLVVYASDQSHSSVEKAARLAGFGLDNLRTIESDAQYALRLDLLEAAIEQDLRAGRRPCALVATTGTTATTALDPVAGMAEIAARHGLWLHVDSAMAGTAMVIPEHRWMWAGIERADSLVFNPHKWMGIGFDCSVYFIRDAQHLVRVMGTDPSFLRTSRDGQVRNLRDWGIPLGRRFRALKALFYLMDEGVDGIADRVRRDLTNAQWLAAQVDATPDWQRLAPTVLQTVALRHRPAGLTDEAQLTRHNQALADRINGSGRAYLTPARVKEVQLLRVSVGAERTEQRHVESLWQQLQEAAAALISQ